MGKEKLVTYGIPSYNHLKYIKKAIDSVLEQTYKNIELIVIDDCSNDGSDLFLKEYSKEKGFKYIRNDKNIGPSKTSMKLLNMANGEYVCLLASDDWIDPRKVEFQMRYLEDTNWKIDVLYGSVIEVIGKKKHIAANKENNIIISHEEALRSLYETGKGLGLLQSGIMKREVARKIGFLEGYKSDDFLFFVRMLQNGYSTGYFAMPLTYYRLHDYNSHKNPDYCLFELEIPVVRDFFPKEYQKRHYARFWLNASIKWYHQKKYIKSLRYFIYSLYLDFNREAVYNYFIELTGTKIVDIKRKVGLENVTFIKRK